MNAIVKSTLINIENLAKALHNSASYDKAVADVNKNVKIHQNTVFWSSTPSQIEDFYLKGELDDSELAEILNKISTQAELSNLFENHIHETYETAVRDDFHCSYRNSRLIKALLEKGFFNSHLIDKFEKILKLPIEIDEFTNNDINGPIINGPIILQNFFEYLKFWNNYVEFDIDWHSGGSVNFLSIEFSNQFFDDHTECQCPQTSYVVEKLIKDSEFLFQFEKTQNFELSRNQRASLLEILRDSEVEGFGGFYFGSSATNLKTTIESFMKSNTKFETFTDLVLELVNSERFENLDKFERGLEVLKEDQNKLIPFLNPLEFIIDMFKHYSVEKLVVKMLESASVLRHEKLSVKSIFKLDQPFEETAKSQNLASSSQDLEKLHKFDVLFALTHSNEVAQNRLIEIVENQLESNYDFESLMKYLNKKEKKSILNI